MTEELNLPSGLWNRLTLLGITGRVPRTDYYRIISYNIICLICILINIFNGIVDYLHDHRFLLSLNILYIVISLLALGMNSLERLLLSRVIFLTVIYAGLSFSALSIGSEIQIQHFILVVGALTFLMFNHEERAWRRFFTVTAVILFVILGRISGPLLNLEPTPFTAQDLAANQFSFAVALMLTLHALAKAYDRSLRLIHEQNLQLLEQRRIQSVALMSSRMAHEINSPLTALGLTVLRLENVLGKDGPPPSVDLVQKIQRLSNRMANIVRSFKYLSKEFGSEEFKQVQFSKLLAETLELVEDRLNSRQIRVTTPARDFQMMCKPVAISQVIMNLLNNSIDAVEGLENADRWIDIQCDLDENGDFHLAVTDGGPTPPPEVQQRMFESFFTTKPIGKGTGLGLAISREIARVHHGELELDSTSDRTRFILKIPKLS